MNSPFSDFPNYRPFQETVIEAVLKSEAKVTFIDGPPGTGKSLIGMSLAIQKSHSLYLCTTKPLQAQIQHDFPMYPMLMGRSNYPCNYSDSIARRFPDITCEDCVGGKEQKKSCKPRCAYEQQKRKCLASQIAVLNTTYFLTEANMVGGFSGKDLVIVDECDRLEDAIVRFIEFTINENSTEALGFNIPDRKTILGWKKWAESILPELEGTVDLEESMITPNSPREEVREFKQLKSLLRKVTVLNRYLDDSWVYQEGAGKYGPTYNFKPVWISDFASGFMWEHSNRFILMSGSIFPEHINNVEPETLISGESGSVVLDMAEELGLNPGDWDYIEVPNQFQAEQRPTFYFPVANLTAKTMAQEQECLVKPVQDIIAKYPGSKGLIHSVSYRLNEFMMFRLRGDPRLVSHVGGIGQREALLEEFKQSPKPLVMMSPTMDRGIDLPYDQCRFIILLKVPYPSLGDKQIASRVRSKNGNRWYAWTTVCSIVQASMRGMRAIDDSVEIWILDAQFGRFFAKAKNVFPQWWVDALQEVPWEM